jgi:uncharacterized repeat protein (TIGR02543 family)
MAGGATNTGAFTLTNNTAITWNWNTEYYLDTAVSGSGSLDVAAGWHAAGSTATVIATADAGWRFDHWMVDGQPAGGTTNVLAVQMDAAHTVEAGFVVLDLAEALDTTGLVWTVGAMTNWFPQTVVSHDGIDAARSGAISHKQTSWLQTTVTNAGTLRYWWKVSCETNFDFYSVSLDGAQQQAISGEKDWAQVSLRVEGAGPHVLKWQYAKDKSFSAGEDCGWLDQVAWLADVWLDTEVEGNGSVDTTDGWRRNGSNVVIRATPAAHHHFAGWSGDTAGCTTNGLEITAPMTQSRRIAASFLADTYTVTFDAAGGSVSPAGRTVSFNSVYGALPVPERTGYTVNGWWTAEHGAGAQIAATTVVSITTNHTLYADWTPNTYAVTYDAAGGSVSPGSKTVVFDATYGTLAIPARTGYTSGGWWTESGGSGAAVTAATVMTTSSNHTIYAKWIPNTYTVTYNAEGGSVTPGSKSVVFNAAYGLLGVPSRAGYTFGGWWTGPGGTGSEVTPETGVATAANHTLYAKWTANPYTATFDAEGGTVTPASKTVTFNAAYAALPVPTRAGHTFGGWWDGDNGTGLQVDAATIVATAQDHSLHAKWLINSHSLTVNSDHGTTFPAVGTRALNWGTNLVCSVNSPDTQGTTRYVCSGWSGSGSVPPVGTLTNTGIFSLTNDSSITWNWNTEYFLDMEVSGSGTTDRADSWHAKGSNITVQAFAEGGSRFDHWTLDGVQMGGNTNSLLVPMDAPRQLVAHFVVLDLPEALDNRELVWTNGGDEAWIPQIAMTYDGVDAARSGLIADYGSTWIQTSVSGKGTVSFWWKVSSEEDCDFLHFHVNGSTNQSISGETDWALVSLHFDSDEEHVLRWAYKKDKSDVAGDDCGWLDQVVWTPDAPPLTGFALWADGHGLTGDAAELFVQDRNSDGVPNGFEFAFGTNLSAEMPLLNIRKVNGRVVVETPSQDGVTVPYVDIWVRGSTNLIDWALPIAPAANTAGKPAGRDWHEPAGAAPAKAFFRLEAELK